MIPVSPKLVDALFGEDGIDKVVAITYDDIGKHLNNYKGQVSPQSHRHLQLALTLQLLSILSSQIRKHFLSKCAI